MPGTTLPRGNVLTVKIFALTLTPTQVGANTTSEQTFTCVGTAVGDYLNGNAVSTQTTGIGIVNVRVVTANTLAVTFSNSTGGALTPVAGSYEFSLQRSENSPLPSDAT